MLLLLIEIFSFSYALYWGLNGARSSISIFVSLLPHKLPLKCFLALFPSTNFFTFVFCELLLASYCLLLLFPFFRSPLALSVSTHKSRLSFSLNFCFDFQFKNLRRYIFMSWFFSSLLLFCFINIGKLHASLSPTPAWTLLITACVFFQLLFLFSFISLRYN